MFVRSLSFCICAIVISVAPPNALAQTTRFEFAKDWSADVDPALVAQSSEQQPAQLATEENFVTQPNEPKTAAPTPSQTETPAPAPETTTVAPETAEENNAAELAAEKKKATLPDYLKELIGPLEELTKRIDELHDKVERLKGRDSSLVSLVPVINEVIYDSDVAIENLQPRLDRFTTQLTKLGPAPDGKDVPEDTPEIALEREQLGLITASIDGAIKKAALARERASQLVATLQSYRQSIFTRNLFERTTSPLMPSTWKEVWLSIPRALEQINYIVRDWWAQAYDFIPALIGLFGLAVLVYVSSRHVVSHLLQTKLPRNPVTPPSFFTRAATAGWAAAAMVLPPALAASILYFGINTLGLFDARIQPLARQVYVGFLVYAAAAALAHAYLQPNRPNWRLIEFATPAARRTSWVIKAIAGLYAIDIVLREGIRILFLPLPVSIAEAFVTSIGFCALLFTIVRTRFSPANSSSPEQVHLSYPRLLKLPLIVVAVFVVLASLMGYVALGHFVAGQVVLTGTTIVLIILLYLAIQAIAGDLKSGPSVPGRLMGQAFGLSEIQQSQLAWGVAGLLNIALAIFAVPLIFVSLGFSFAEVISYAKSLLFGFDVGGIRISLAQIAIAIGLFVGVIFATKLLQRWLTSRIENNGRADRGLSNSIRTGIGYIGFGLASLVAVSYAGLDITNLAIVAGALSVGIGFGLQSIVNNFVSGLILLVERPIKVGDMIEVSGQRGHVRRISVRSTEIETFDKASVIIPNADLISTSVINLTHQNAMGRLLIPVGVAYDSDPVQVRQILEKIAKDCDLVMPYPAPSVSFDELGASSLDFTMRVYVANVNNGLSVKTELRTQIVLAFRAAGIEIPYPQQDVHLRDLDGVRQIVSQAIANRARQNTGASATATEHSEQDPKQTSRREPEPAPTAPTGEGDD